jgi:Pentapeptide repeats (8 copies)
VAGGRSTVVRRLGRAGYLPPGGVDVFRQRKPDFSHSSEQSLRAFELALRDREVRNQRRISVVQIGTIIIAFMAAGAALWAARNAGRSADVSEVGVRRQANENRLTTAVNSIGEDLPAQRVAGFTLLRRHAIQRLEEANESDVTDAERRDALRLYNGTIQVIATYLKERQPSETEAASQPPNQLPAECGGGEAPKNLPIDATYAAQELRRLLQGKPEYLQLWRRAGRGESIPVIDLTNTNLNGLSWPSIDFAWLGSRFVPGVVLSDANLTDSHFEGSTERPTTLRGAHLECARLMMAHLSAIPERRIWFSRWGSTLFTEHVVTDYVGANLEGAHLEGAHLEGAHLEGTNLTGAHLEGAHLEGAHVKCADFTGAAIDPGALDNAQDHDQAKGVSEQGDRRASTRCRSRQ